MPEYSEKDLLKMQNDAMKRVMEMQRRAKESYSSSQNPSVPAPGQKPFEPLFSSQEAQDAFNKQSKPDTQNTAPCPDLVKMLFLLLGTDDPILSAALAYLL